LIPDRLSRHSASFDPEGNIILPEHDQTPTPDRETQSGGADQMPPTHAAIETLRSFTNDAVHEGIREYVVSIEEAGPLLGDLKRDTVSVLRRFWNFLVQPVWIPGKHKEAKEYSRVTLFVLDCMRFGGTFAAIFLVLFTVLNYQSFFEIAKARFGPLLATPSVTSSEQASDDSLQQSLMHAQTAGAMRGDLLSILPEVGPPDNRVIIPKLRLNIPLVTPSYDALLREDWTQVETDIQEALQDGVVHYPGTANPGQAGNFFVTGHSSYYPWAEGKYKTVFARLQDLKEGDEYWVYFNGDKHRYIVQTKKEVQPSDVTVLDQPPDLRISTLMTCTPVGTTLRRLIVVAQEVDPETGKPMRVGEHTEGTTKKVPLEALPI
jgi:LPXTG-site transpeptidase (sortase) family protein